MPGLRAEGYGSQVEDFGAVPRWEDCWAFGAEEDIGTGGEGVYVARNSRLRESVCPDL